MSGISNSRIISQTSFTPFLIFVVIGSSHNSAHLAKLTHDSRSHGLGHGERQSKHSYYKHYRGNERECLLFWCAFPKVWQLNCCASPCATVWSSMLLRC